MNENILWDAGDVVFRHLPQFHSLSALELHVRNPALSLPRQASKKTSGRLIETIQERKEAGLDQGRTRSVVKVHEELSFLSIHHQLLYHAFNILYRCAVYPPSYPSYPSPSPKLLPPLPSPPPPPPPPPQKPN